MYHSCLHFSCGTLVGFSVVTPLQNFHHSIVIFVPYWKHHLKRSPLLDLRAGSSGDLLVDVALLATVLEILAASPSISLILRTAVSIEIGIH